MTNDLTPLKSARIKKNWTPKFVSEKVGVSLNTYIRWETGAQTPRHSSLHALCQIFDMSPEELGFAELQSSSLKKDNLRESKKTSSSNLQCESSNLAETLALWSMGIASCWQLYMTGGQTELEKVLPTYLANLAKPTLYPGPDQKKAARLTSQVYQLQALLELQRGDLAAAQTNGTQALVYSQLSRDWNMYIAAQIRLGTVFIARKRPGSALNAYNDALRRINAEAEHISPILQSWIFAGLAEIQASMGREKDAIQFLQLSYTVFPDIPADDSCFTYTQCDRSILYMYEGMVFLRLGQPKLAWEAFAQIDDLKPAPPERTRTEFLLQKAYTSFILGNMTQSCIYLEAAAKASQTIKSDLYFSEAFVIYEHMLAMWGTEPRVKALARLFQR